MMEQDTPFPRYICLCCIQSSWFHWIYNEECKTKINSLLQSMSLFTLNYVEAIIIYKYFLFEEILLSEYVIRILSTGYIANDRLMHNMNHACSRDTWGNRYELYWWKRRNFNVLNEGHYCSLLVFKHKRMGWWKIPLEHAILVLREIFGKQWYFDRMEMVCRKIFMRTVVTVFQELFLQGNLINIQRKWCRKG